MSEEDYARRKALEQSLHKIPGIREKLCFDKRQAKASGGDGSGATAYTLAEKPPPPSQDAQPTSGARADDEQTPSKFQWPAPMAPEAFHGPAGEVVRLISPHSEADDAALLLHFVAGFGSLAGRHAYYVTDGARQYANLYTLIVGRTAKARKGTAANQAFSILREVDPEWASNRVMSGSSSGEGVIWQVRDPIHEASPIREKSRVIGYEDIESDRGISDKRLLIFEAEFARVLKVMERDSNTLSAVLREAFDTGNLNTMIKKQAAKATSAHVSFIGHITKDELQRELTDTSKANGFINRFLIGCARRSKLLPEGGNLDLDTEDRKQLIERLRKAAIFARTTGEMKRDDEAKAIWCGVYESLSEGKPGMFGAITSRGDCLVVRLSIIFALLDCSAIIKARHLQAALAVWRYCEDSARFIFGDSLGDQTADEILRALRMRVDGMTRTELRDLFQRNRSGEEIGRALGVLQENGLASIERCRESTDQIKPTERWFAITVSSRHSQVVNVV